MSVRDALGKLSAASQGDPTREELLEALRRADAAGDTRAAVAIASRIDRMEGGKRTKGGLTGRVTDDRSFGDQLAETAKQRAAAAVKGVTYPFQILEDLQRGVSTAVNYGLEGVGTTALNAVGLNNAADWWQRAGQNARSNLQRQPTIRGAIERIVPPPTSTSGKAADFVTEVVAGAALPFGLLNNKRAAFPKGDPSGGVKAAGRRQNVPVRGPDANPAMRNKAAGIEASPYGGPKVGSAYADDIATIQQRAQSVSPGKAETEAYNLGEKIQKAGKAYIERTGKQFGRQYDKVDDLSRGVTVNPKQAIKAVDDEIADLVASGAQTNKAQIAYLRGLREDLAKPGGFTMKQFQGLRSANKGVIRGDTNLASSDATRRLDNVVRAFSDDAAEQLPGEAVSLLKETDKAYALRQAFIKDVLQRHVLGRRNNPINPERAATNIDKLSKGNFDAVSSLWGILPEGLQAEVAATRAAGLGVNPGGQFQAGRFATDVEKFPSNIRGLMYGDEGAQALDDLGLLARAKSDTMGAFNNSRTSVPLLQDAGRRLMQGAGAGVGVGMATGNPILGALAAIGTEGMRAASQIRGANKILKDVAGKAAQKASTGLQPTGGLLAAMENPATQMQVISLLDARVAARLAAEQREEEQRRQRGLLAPAGY